MNITVGSFNITAIRRDLLLAAGCRSTAFSRNNGGVPAARCCARTNHTAGDGKFHRPGDAVSSEIFNGPFKPTGPQPFNFDWVRLKHWSALWAWADHLHLRWTSSPRW
jgi:hypothetical protein